MEWHKAILAPDGDGLADAHETLLVFGGDQETARRSYVRALEAGARSSWLEREPGRLPWWRAGDGTEMPPPPQGTPRIDALGASTAPERRALRPDEDLFAAANALGVALPALSGSRSGRELTRLRGMLALVAVETYGVRVKDRAAPREEPRRGESLGQHGRGARSHDETFRDRAEQPWPRLGH
jgi:hypothetical protein